VQLEGGMFWKLDEMIKNIDICAWFREEGETLFQSVALLAWIWLERSPTTAFQERVFSSGGIVMSKLRTRTANERAENQLLLKHNSHEIAMMGKICKEKTQPQL
ncbi:hypothetical protein PHMEG_00038285, partial [Phytophthora megakarya]